MNVIGAAAVCQELVIVIGAAAVSVGCYRCRRPSLWTFITGDDRRGVLLLLICIASIELFRSFARKHRGAAVRICVVSEESHLSRPEPCASRRSQTLDNGPPAQLLNVSTKKNNPIDLHIVPLSQWRT